MFQNVRIGSFFNVQLIMHYLNSFLSCSIRNLTLASLSRLFTIKIDIFALFTSLWSFSMKAITENQLHDFLIKGQLQRFHKLSLFDRFRHVENGLDINF